MTAKSPVLPVQSAVFDVLSGDATLTGLVSGIYDYVDEDAAYPYVEIGETTETPDNTHGEHGRQQVITLHVWSKHRGYSEALDITDRITELLDHTELTVDGFHHVYTHFEFSQTLRDPDPDVRHVPIRFRIATEQPA